MSKHLPVSETASTGEGKAFTSIGHPTFASLGLEDVEGRLRVLSDNLPNGIVYQMVINRDGTSRAFTYVSKAIRHLRGVTVNEAMADVNVVYNQLVPEDLAKLAQIELTCLQKLQPLRAEYRIQHPSGEIRWMRATSSPRQLTDEWFAWDGIEMDITEEKRQRERERFDAEFRTLIAELSAKFVQVKDQVEFDQAVDQSLAALGKLFGVDRSYLFRFSPDLSLINNTHEWCAPGITAERDNEQNLPAADLPWWMERIQTMQPLQILDVNALPSEASAEKERFQRQNIRSMICVPFSDHHGKLSGFIGFDAVRQTYAWQPEEMHMLRVVADLIGRAITHVGMMSALAESEALLKQTGALAKIGGWELFPETGEIKWTEQAYCIHEIPQHRQPLVDEALAFYAPDDRPILEAAIQRAIDIGEAYDLQLRLVTTKGNKRWVRTICQPEVRDGKVVKLKGTFQDITQQRLAGAERQRLLQAIEQTEDVVMITNAEGDIQYVNPAFEKITGYTRSEAVGRNPRFLKSGKHSAAFYKELWEVIGSGRTWKGTLVNKRKNGSLYSEEATISPIKDERGSVVSYVAVKRDITEKLRMMEESRTLAEQFHQAQKLESVGRLAGGVAHDFNNMLSVIIGNIEFALEQCKPEDQSYRDLNDALQAAEQSADLTRQLLMFARKQTIETKSLDLNESIAKMLKLLRRLIGEDIELIWKPSPREVMVNMDPVQIDQLLANLCVNARDAISGAGTIVISTLRIEIDAASVVKYPEAQPGRYAVVEVQDTGCGVPSEHLDNIFEPFFTTKASQGGTGLGLATVYGIVKQNGGFIDVASTVGKGATFRLHLPCEETGQISAAEPVKAGAPTDATATILLVEDEMAVRKIFVRWLRRAGYTTLEAATPSEALEIVEAFKGDIDLLLTDVILPGMNGRELADRIVADKPELKIIYMSGYAADKIDKHHVLTGSVKFLSKPFDHATLLEAIHSALVNT